jgi:hypothetical protein
MTDELDLLRAWHPPTPVTALPASVAAAQARTRLDAHIAGGPRPHRRVVAPRPRRRWWLLAAPGALAAAAATALILTLGSGVENGSVAPRSAAAQALDRAADAAERAPAVAPFPTAQQFLYIKSQATYMDISVLGHGRTIPSLDTSTTETWQSAAHPGQQRSFAKTTRWPSAAARRAWIAAGRPALTGAAGLPDALPRATFYLGNEQLTYAQVRGFDQPAAAVYRRLRDHYVEGQGGNIDNELFTQVGDALRQRAAPPKLRAALYRTLALIPGVQYLGHVRDRLGRPAVGVARTDDATGAKTRHELLFDPRTSELLAEQEVMLGIPSGLRGLVRPGTVTGDAVYLRRAVVDRLGERP